MLLFLSPLFHLFVRAKKFLGERRRRLSRFKKTSCAASNSGKGRGVSGTPKPGLVVKYERYTDCVILLIFSRFCFF